MSAVAIGQLGRLDAAIQLLHEVLEANPQSLEPLNYLALYLRTSGRLEEAVDVSRRMIAAAPDRVDGHNSLGLCFLGLRRFMEAAECFERTILIGPRVPMFHHNLATAYFGAGRLDDAERSLRRVIAMDPGNRNSLTLLAQLLIDANRGSEAAPLLRKAYELDPDSYSGQMNLATACLEESNPTAALKALDRASELMPDSSDGHDQIGSALQQLGRFEEAAAHLRKAIELDPDRARPYFELAFCAKVTEEDRPLMERLRAFADRTDLRVNALANVHYALGKAHDDLKEYGEAMKQFNEANRIMYEVKKNAYNPESQRTFVDKLIQVFDLEFFQKHRDAGSSSDLPVLIVGMIRSGTTLTEQILTRHPAIGAGAELRFWLDDKLPVFDPSNLNASKPRMETLETGYLKILKELAPGMPRVTDKQPLNHTHLGLIHLAFPKARIVHCRRHPVDTCLSIFFTPFRGSLNWGHDKARIVGAYREYLRLMDHWRKVLASEVFFEVDYRGLVTDRESVTRRMIDFLGLEWDDACLSHEENLRVVVTPSLWQVRQPVYTSSLDRWRRYEPWLGPFRDLLTPDELASVGG